MSTVVRCCREQEKAELAQEGGLTINRNQHATARVSILWRLHSALHCRRDSVSYMAQ